MFSGEGTSTELHIRKMVDEFTTLLGVKAKAVVSLLGALNSDDTLDQED
jgi:hypothetical protein